MLSSPSPPLASGDPDPPGIVAEVLAGPSRRPGPPPLSSRPVPTEVGHWSAMLDAPLPSTCQTGEMLRGHRPIRPGPPGGWGAVRRFDVLNTTDERGIHEIAAPGPPFVAGHRSH